MIGGPFGGGGINSIENDRNRQEGENGSMIPGDGFLNAISQMMEMMHR